MQGRPVRADHSRTHGGGHDGRDTVPETVTEEENTGPTAEEQATEAAESLNSPATRSDRADDAVRFRIAITQSPFDAGQLKTMGISLNPRLKRFGGNRPAFATTDEAQREELALTRIRRRSGIEVSRT